MAGVRRNFLKLLTRGAQHLTRNVCFEEISLACEARPAFLCASPEEKLLPDAIPIFPHLWSSTGKVYLFLARKNAWDGS